MRSRTIQASAFFAAAWLSAFPSSAQSHPFSRDPNASAVATAPPNGTWLDVERDAGSMHCPDGDAVFRAIGRLFPERSQQRSSDPTVAAASARVKIRPTSVGHEAILSVTLPRPGERVILENDAACRGLADALAVALVMLLDAPAPQTSAASTSSEPATAPAAAAVLAPAASNVVTTEQVPPVAPSKPKPEPKQDQPGPQQRKPSASAATPTPETSPTTDRDNADPSPAHPLQMELRASAVGGIGLLNRAAVGPAIGFELFYRDRWGLSLQGLRLWASPIDQLDGTLKLTLWGGFFGPCYRQRFTERSSLDICLRLGVGSQHADAQRFPVSSSGEFLWLVTGPSARYTAALFRTLHGFAALGAIGQLQPQQFSVGRGDGSGARDTIAEAPKFGLLAELGFELPAGGF